MLELPMTEPLVEWVEHPEAESWKDMSVRLASFMVELMRQSPQEPILIVSHRNALIAIVHWWLGLGEEHWLKMSYQFDRGSISNLTVNRFGERTISKLNDTSHLMEP